MYTPTAPHLIPAASRDKRRRKLCGTAAALAVVGVLSGATPAAAAPVEKGRFHDTGSELLEDVCAVDVVFAWDVSGSFHGVPHGSDGLVHYRDSVRGSETYTNTVTGRSYTLQFSGAHRDHEVTDNGDGTLSIIIQGSGSEKWYDGDGQLVLRNPGMTRGEILVDNAGTPSDPFDDEFIEFVGDVKESTGRNDTQGRDFCEDLLLYTA